MDEPERGELSREAMAFEPPDTITGELCPNEKPRISAGQSLNVTKRIINFNTSTQS